MIRRRDFIRSGMLGAGALAFGPAFWQNALATAPATTGPGPYGPLQPPDANGVMLPKGFRSRVIAQGGRPVENTTYSWHFSSDGQATFPTDDGGFILVSNAEVPVVSDLPGEAAPPNNAEGGASAIRFRADGTTTAAYRILRDTISNCSGGATPWGTWLSCEEFDGGRVWECDPFGKKAAVPYPALGIFSHEAVAVDPIDQRFYLTEDQGDGGLYRFTPKRWPDMTEGVLEVATGTNEGPIKWVPLPDPQAKSGPTRKQVQGMVVFRRGEGIFFDSGVVYVATTSDDRVYAYDTTTESLEIVYDGRKIADPPLKDVDNITVSRSGDIFVCEDSGDDDPFDIGIITPERVVTRFLKLTGPQHGADANDTIRSETTGVTFDPSGTRMYFASQRAFGVGVIYEITGPFRLERPASTLPSSLRVRVPRRILRGRVLERGVFVTLLTPEPLTVTATLKTTVTRAGRTRTVTLGQAKQQVDNRGRAVLRVKLSRSGRAFVRRRRNLSAIMSVRTVNAAGRRRTTKRAVAIRAFERRS